MYSTAILFNFQYCSMSKFYVGCFIKKEHNQQHFFYAFTSKDIANNNSREHFQIIWDNDPWNVHIVHETDNKREAQDLVTTYVDKSQQILIPNDCAVCYFNQHYTLNVPNLSLLPINHPTQTNSNAPQNRGILPKIKKTLFKKKLPTASPRATVFTTVSAACRAKQHQDELQLLTTSVKSLHAKIDEVLRILNTVGTKVDSVPNTKPMQKLRNDVDQISSVMVRRDRKKNPNQDGVATPSDACGNSDMLIGSAMQSPELDTNYFGASTNATSSAPSSSAGYGTGSGVPSTLSEQRYSPHETGSISDVLRDAASILNDDNSASNILDLPQTGETEAVAESRLATPSQKRSSLLRVNSHACTERCGRVTSKYRPAGPQDSLGLKTSPYQISSKFYKKALETKDLNQFKLAKQLLYMFFDKAELMVSDVTGSPHPQKGKTTYYQKFPLCFKRLQALCKFVKKRYPDYPIPIKVEDFVDNPTLSDLKVKLNEACRMVLNRGQDKDEYLEQVVHNIT